ncbi:MAG TPA: hypothetical protein PKA28_03660 [Methylomusa anaerophila]|uniref:Uncharacterized protein n=1 Tax=Methylomusa anaerophila TaxID=1930071 RepID=A0A348ANH4_9FIRM|nr:hypothetical protein [Methylomusa anaerophila]BBB92622.1 hypothetical protein MAMMFC1_03317 [Methylomusa anaerophila]HML87524.1 hypothetical protein [Methylomusa anaerophila]
MQDNSMKWLLGVVTVIVTLALLLGGQFVWNRYAVAKPLDKMFNGIQGVEQVTVDFNDQIKSNEQVSIQVKLGDIDNLQKVYTEVIKNLEKKGGTQKYDLVIQDDRSPELEDFYYSVHYYIQEAIVTGKFAVMAERIQSQSNSAGVNTQVYVDTDNIYLQMKKNGRAMYVITPRSHSKEVR